MAYRSTPTFALKRVNPLQVLTDYQSGVFNRMRLNAAGEIDLTPQIEPQYISYRSGACVVQAIITHPTQRTCTYCHLPINPNLRLGIPIASKEIEIDGVRTRQYILVGANDTIPCAQMEYRRKVGTARHREPQYADSGTLLKHLAFDLTGSDKIMTLPASELLVDNGGTVPRDAFFGGKFQYVPSSRIMLTHTSTQHTVLQAVQ